MIFGKRGEIEKKTFSNGVIVEQPNYVSLAGFVLTRGEPRPGDAIVTINVAHEFDSGRTVDLGGKLFPDVERVATRTVVHGQLRALFEEFLPAIQRGAISAQAVSELQAQALQLDEMVQEVCETFLRLRQAAGLPFLSDLDNPPVRTVKG